MKANDGYYGGKPLIDRVTLMPYTSVRSAWADLLRGKVDMLYDVGVDALDSLESSNDVKIFTFQRGYAYLLLLNVRRPYLADAGFRRELNAAIDRDALIADGLRGHGTPALGAVWPYHWAYSPDMPQFSYRPRRLTSELSGRRLKASVWREITRAARACHPAPATSHQCRNRVGAAYLASRLLLGCSPVTSTPCCRTTFRDRTSFVRTCSGTRVASVQLRPLRNATGRRGA